jgi:UDP-N-acetylglucosamine 2-epimerase (hydrolysing)
MSKKILFVTGTRADFGKIKTLIKACENTEGFEPSVFVTGMHTLSRYGYTVDEVYKALDLKRLSEGFRNVYTYINQTHGEPMERVLANTINGLSLYVSEFHPDLIVVHGDRVETLAGATVGALRNIKVAHIEGGEVSGTVDELIRHSVSKLSHVHFVANDEAKNRLLQLGEANESVYVIGSPDIDIMTSENLPTLDEVRDYYEIPFSDYSVVLFHPVTTDLVQTASTAKNLVSAAVATGDKFVVIYPNNDTGCDLIFDAYKELEGNPNFRTFPSMRMEYFLTVLKNSKCILGNSSAGVREAPVYGTQTINIESRQHRRFQHSTIIDCQGDRASIISAYEQAIRAPRAEANFHFGTGNSADLFIETLRAPSFWEIATQKGFVERG